MSWLVSSSRLLVAISARIRHSLRHLWIAPALMLSCGVSLAQMTTPGQFAVSPGGAATYSIPIQVPPGTAGMQPSLALTYNSQGGNGLAGVGWSISGLSAIHRCPATYIQDGFAGGVNFDASDRFCLDGQRLIAIAGTNGAAGTEYRTETESFARVISYGSSGSGPQYFVAWTKSGQIMQFGPTNNVFANNANYPSVRVWPVETIKDRTGNGLTVTYSQDGGDFYPLDIRYGGNINVGTAPYASVHFDYINRSDVETAYQAGSMIQTRKLLNKIQTCNAQDCTFNPLVLEYRLSYATSPATGRLRLAAIAQCESLQLCCCPTALRRRKLPMVSLRMRSNRKTGDLQSAGKRSRVISMGTVVLI